MSDGITRAMTRKVRTAFEYYMVTQYGWSPEQAIRAFNNWHDEIEGKAAHGDSV